MARPDPDERMRDIGVTPPDERDDGSDEESQSEPDPTDQPARGNDPSSGGNRGSGDSSDDTSGSSGGKSTNSTDQPARGNDPSSGGGRGSGDRSDDSNDTSTGSGSSSYGSSNDPTDQPARGNDPSSGGGSGSGDSEPESDPDPEPDPTDQPARGGGPKTSPEPEAPEPDPEPKDPAQEDQSKEQDKPKEEAEPPPKTPEPEQGVETEAKAGQVAAVNFEEDIVNKYEQLDREDVRITRDGDTLEAELTSTGQEAMTAAQLGLNERDIAVTGQGEVVPTSERGEQELTIRSIEDGIEEQYPDAQSYSIEAGNGDNYAVEVTTAEGSTKQFALGEDIPSPNTELTESQRFDKAAGKVNRQRSAQLEAANQSQPQPDRDELRSDLEQQLEEQAGVDFDQQSDIRYEEESRDGQTVLTAELTDRGEKTVAEQTQFSGKAEGTPFQGAARTLGGLNYEYGQFRENFADDPGGTVGSALPDVKMGSETESDVADIQPRLQREDTSKQIERRDMAQEAAGAVAGMAAFTAVAPTGLDLAFESNDTVTNAPSTARPEIQPARRQDEVSNFEERVGEISQQDIEQSRQDREEAFDQAVSLESIRSISGAIGDRAEAPPETSPRAQSVIDGDAQAERRTAAQNAVESFPGNVEVELPRSDTPPRNIPENPDRVQLTRAYQQAERAVANLTNEDEPVVGDGDNAPISNEELTGGAPVVAPGGGGFGSVARGVAGITALAGGGLAARKALQDEDLPTAQAEVEIPKDRQPNPANEVEVPSRGEVYQSELDVPNPQSQYVSDLGIPEQGILINPGDNQSPTRTTELDVPEETTSEVEVPDKNQPDTVAPSTGSTVTGGSQAPTTPSETPTGPSGPSQPTVGENQETGKGLQIGEERNGVTVVGRTPRDEATLVNPEERFLGYGNTATPPLLDQAQQPQAVIREQPMTGVPPIESASLLGATTAGAEARADAASSPSINPTAATQPMTEASPMGQSNVDTYSQPGENSLMDSQGQSEAFSRDFTNTLSDPVSNPMGQPRVMADPVADPQATPDATANPNLYDYSVPASTPPAQGPGLEYPAPTAGTPIEPGSSSRLPRYDLPDTDNDERLRPGQTEFGVEFQNPIATSSEVLGIKSEQSEPIGDVPEFDPSGGDVDFEPMGSSAIDPDKLGGG